jgi:hypothetical protein
VSTAWVHLASVRSAPSRGALSPLAVTMALAATGSKSIFFRSVKVRRLYDRHSNALVYVSYADRLTVSETEDMDKK